MPPQTNALSDCPTANDLACIVMHAVSEHHRTGLGLGDLLGLNPRELKDLCLELSIYDYYPAIEMQNTAVRSEQQSITTLIIWRGRRTDRQALWLAKILARRAMEPHHLWEDLGLPSRERLNTLMMREFPALARQRPSNMRWKKFLYRQICADPGHTVCPAPSCDACNEYDACFVTGEMA
ncbi:MAG: nitrogen fixation protein NifQ [Pseudomonadota bacterium]